MRNTCGASSALQLSRTACPGEQAGVSLAFPENPQSRRGPISPFLHGALTKLPTEGAGRLKLAVLFAFHRGEKLHLSRETGRPVSEMNEVGSKIRFPELSSTGTPSQRN
jgi:hypothetical protein